VLLYDEGWSEKYMVKQTIICLIIICVILVGCEKGKPCESSEDCADDEYCFQTSDIFSSASCVDKPYYYYPEMNATENATRLNINNMIEEVGQNRSLFRAENISVYPRNLTHSDMYCYDNTSTPDDCTCDLLIYPDGHNESRDCWCYNDLIIHYTCINITKENITVIRDVPQ
jgi:hypothetical protein